MSDPILSRTFSRIDPHVHSVFSGHADNAWLRRFGFRESESAPEDIARTALRRGMDFVALTDHDTIEGAKRLAHLDCFIPGEEVTARFPEDGALAHVVVLGVDEQRHRDLQALRGNLYELAEYLHREKAVHFAAHPFYRMGPQLTLGHLERLLLLFKTFEVRNGGKQLNPPFLMEDILSALTPECVWEWADRHGLEPLGEEPWRKHRVAGSDDHGGFLIARPHTRFPVSNSIEEALGHFAAGRTGPDGPGGSPLAVSHNVLSVAFHNLRRKRLDSGRSASGPAWELAGRFLGNRPVRRSTSIVVRGLVAATRIPSLERRIPLGRKGRTLKAALIRRLRNDPLTRRFAVEGPDFSGPVNEELFTVLSGWIQEAWRLHLEEGRFRTGDMLFTAAATLVVGGAYAAALKTETADRPLMAEARRALLDRPEPEPAAVVFTDGPSREVVEILSRKWLLRRSENGCLRLHVFGLSFGTEARPDRIDFIPLGSVPVSGQPVPVPPVLDVIHALYDLDIGRIFVKSFGPMGILGLVIGRWLGIETVCHVPRMETLPEGMRSAATAALRFADRVVVLNPTEVEAAMAAGVQDRRLDRRFVIRPAVVGAEADMESWEERLE